MDQEESSNVLSLVWQDLEKMPGDVVVVSCAGASSGSTSNNVTSAWTTSMSEVIISISVTSAFGYQHQQLLSVFQVMTSVVVPGADVEDEVSDDDDDMEDDN